MLTRFLDLSGLSAEGPACRWRSVSTQAHVQTTGLAGCDHGLFLKSLTQYWDGKLIAVIVSGFHGDGVAALCGIKDMGGTTIAQKLDTANQPDMPESAIDTGCIDFVLSPEDIAREIVRIAQAKDAL